MIDIEKEEAIWKTYPEYPFIEANQFGEIITKDRYLLSKNRGERLVNGHILKQYLYPNGYMFVRFRLNGKRITLLVHRVIATCFLPNPNNYPVVNHKDNNRANNVVSNLEWCTREYNEAYKKNFGTSQEQIKGRPVFAVNLKTGKVLRFKSQSEAARQLDINVSHINAVVKGRKPTAGGYWFVEDESEITEEKIIEIKDKMKFRGGVIAVNSENGEVFQFESQSEAARKLEIDNSNITKVVKSKRYYKTAGGFWFCYVDENTVEKTRAKFGDDIAKKVEKLISEIYKTFFRN